MKYHIVQLGCQMNISDGERVQQVLDSMGFTPTDKEEEASLLGVIACSVRQKGIDKVYAKISKWNKWKHKKSLITFVSGCVLPADKEQFLKTFDMVFPMSELPELPQMISQYGVVTAAGMRQLDQGIEDIESPVKKEVAAFEGLQLAPFDTTTPSSDSLLQNESTIEDFWHITPKYSSGFEAYIPIQNGCDKFCTYCAVPYTRGREVSRPSQEILQELDQLVQQGFKSITLLGQNVNSYGLDKKGDELNFAALLEEIGKYGQRSGADFWLYFTSPHPRDMSEEVIEVIAKYDCLAKQIHLPVQSGDDEVLVRMNRKHAMSRYREIVGSIRRLIPQATLFTDIIVGFTGETEAQFNNTLNIMAEFKFNMAYIAQYSSRPGAASSRWADDVPKETKKDRYHQLTGELMKYSLAYNKSVVGHTYKVLVRGKDRKPGYLSALTEGRLIIRFASEDEHLIGQFVAVKVASATAFSMEGSLVPMPEAITVSSTAGISH